MVGMELHIAYLHRSHRCEHNGSSYGSRLGSTLAYFNLSLLQHLAYKERAIGKMGEVCLVRIEHGRGTQAADDIIERQLLLDGKLR